LLCVLTNWDLSLHELLFIVIVIGKSLWIKCNSFIRV